MWEGNTTVCDAILNDERFSSQSWWSSVAEGVTCSDLTVDACPPRLQLPNGTIRYDQFGMDHTLSSSVSSPIKDADGFTVKFNFFQEHCCNEDNELNILEGVIDPSADIPLCSSTAGALVFSGANAKGGDGKRWMCQEYGILSTTIRSVYVHLGTLPCLGRTSEPTGAPTAATDAPTSSARQGIPTLTSSLFGSLWILSTGLCYSM